MWLFVKEVRGTYKIFVQCARCKAKANTEHSYAYLWQRARRGDNSSLSARKGGQII